MNVSELAERDEQKIGRANNNTRFISDHTVKAAGDADEAATQLRRVEEKVEVLDEHGTHKTRSGTELMQKLKLGDTVCEGTEDPV